MPRIERDLASCLVEEYKKGRSSWNIAEDFRVSQVTVLREAKRAGIDTSLAATWKRKRKESYDAELQERFWCNVKKTDGCWLWTGPKYKNGYGQAPKLFGTRMAHRIAWILAGNSVSEAEFICHHCDVKLCIRPEHLFVGLPKDNSADARLKGLFFAGDRHWTHRTAERINTSGIAKLTPESVREIRRLYGTVPIDDLSKQYGVNRHSIRFAATGKTWKHIK